MAAALKASQLKGQLEKKKQLQLEEAAAKKREKEAERVRCTLLTS